MTHEFVQLVPKGSKLKIVDTRKTAPGWRMLEKYAVKMGGASNHRAGLDDGILIKDNHIKSAGSIKKAVEKVRASVHHLMRIEVETENLDQVREALLAGADIIMLDNMSNENILKAIEIIGGKALIEVSGGITKERLIEIAGFNIDFVSIGAITHSALSKDINLSIEK